jgi:hypothetical protein
VTGRAASPPDAGPNLHFTRRGGANPCVAGEGTMAEPRKCPTSHCPDKGKAMLPAGPRRHDKDRKITRYKCQTRGQEITQRTA